MSVNEISARLRTKLQEAFGVDEATILMDRPPGGWGDLVTNDSLDRRLDAMERRIDEKFDLKLGGLDLKLDSLEHGFRADMTTLEHKLTATMEREIRAQTWRLMTATIAAMAGLAAAMSVSVAVVSKL